MAETKVVTLDVNNNIDEAAKSVGSLKSQLREAQAEVAKLSDKFGATSQEAVNAAKKASELKDRIGDAKALTDAFNPDAKFRAVSSSLAGVAGGFSAVTGAMGILGAESKQTEEMILKVQSAMAIASGLQQLGESADAFKQMKAVAIDAFKGIKTAIGSTGIGLLVIALGTIYAYWDDIKEAVSGVSEEQKKLNADSQKNLDQENEKLKTIGAQDNILKLQGKSEKEILAIKIKQTDEAIQATEINQKNQIQTNKLAVEGAKRNYELLKSYIDFVSTPLRFLYQTGAEAINGIIDLLNKIPGVNIKGKLDETLGDKAADYITKLGFDPDKVKAEGDKTVKESADALTKLKNDRAGYQLAIKDIDKKASDDKKKNADELEEQRKKDLEDFKEFQKLIRDTEIQNAVDDSLQKKQEDADKLKRLTDLAEASDAIDKEYTDKEKANSDARIALSKLEKEQKIQQLSETANTLNGLADLLGKQTTAGKVAAVASATIETFLSAQKAYSATVGIPVVGPTLAPINAGLAIAVGLKNVKSILSVKTPNGGGGSAPSIGGSGTSAPAAPSFNVVGNGGTNQIAQVMNKQGVAPVQAYVVASNVTSAQSLNRNIVSNATLG
jgi:hypothetical protein